MKKNLLLIAAAVASATGAAQGAMTGSLFTITATSDAGTAEFTVAMPESADGTTMWSLPESISLMSESGEAIATLSEATIRTRGLGDARGPANPVVALNFLVSTGAAGADFTVTSAPLSFPTFDPAQATASAAVTVTDNDGGGASLSGNFAGGGMYRAFYNDIGAIPATGSTFGTLVSDITAGAFGSESTDDTTGPLASVGSPVSSMSAQWQFRVGAGDSASGTSVFTLPTPGAATLAAVAFICPVIRRRR